MKNTIALLILVVLLALTACGDDFDEEAEKEAFAAFTTAWVDAREKGDREATRALLAEDWTFIVSLPDWYHMWTPEDEEPDWWTNPEFIRWDDYEEFVSADLAVRWGYMTLNYNTDPVRVFITSVLKKENGQWKLLHSHISDAGP